MTFKDLQKAIQPQAEQIQPLNLQVKLQGKLFWILDREEYRRLDIATNSNCCFWHVIGLPQEDGHDMSLLAYRRVLYDLLQNHEHT